MNWYLWSSLEPNEVGTTLFPFYRWTWVKERLSNLLKHIPTVSSNFTAWVLLRKNKMCPIYDSKGKRKLFPECIVMITYYDNVGLQLLIENPTTHSHCLGKSVICTWKWLKCIQMLEGKQREILGISLNTWYFSLRTNCIILILF